MTSLLVPHWCVFETASATNSRHDRFLPPFLGQNKDVFHHTSFAVIINLSLIAAKINTSIPILTTFPFWHSCLSSSKKITRKKDFNREPLASFIHHHLDKTTLWTLLGPPRIILSLLYSSLCYGWPPSSLLTPHTCQGPMTSESRLPMRSPTVPGWLLPLTWRRCWSVGSCHAQIYSRQCQLSLRASVTSWSHTRELLPPPSTSRNLDPQLRFIYI